MSHWSPEHSDSQGTHAHRQPPQAQSNRQNEPHASFGPHSFGSLYHLDDSGSLHHNTRGRQVATERQESYSLSAPDCRTQRRSSPYPVLRQPDSLSQREQGRRDLQESSSYLGRDGNSIGFDHRTRVDPPSGNASSRPHPASISGFQSDLRAPHAREAIFLEQEYAPISSQLLASQPASSPIGFQALYLNQTPPMSGTSDTAVLAAPEAIFNSHSLAEGLPFVNQDKAGFFSGAHDFAIKDSTFNIINTGDGSMQSGRSEDWLQKSILDGVEHNSADRDPPPRCHPGTRTGILQRAIDWIDNPQREKRLLWVRGPAGVGKSAIVQTLAETLSTSERLGASLFFSRPNGRSNPQRLFPTLAYQLATRDAPYKAYINELMARDSRPLELKAMKEQFRLLIVEPFAQRKLNDGKQDLLLAIDGLDECDGDPILNNSQQAYHQGRTLEEVHCEIVELISTFVRTYPSVPLIWIIASRSESHIKAVFQSSSVVGSYIEEDIPVDSDEACQDVEKYLHSSFTKIRERYPDHLSQAPWPSNEKFLHIAEAASGLFVFAEVVIRFIGDQRVRRPNSQLECVLTAITNLCPSKDPRNPLSTLDTIYTTILSRIPKDVVDDTKQILPILIYARRKLKVTEYTFQDMYESLRITQEDAVTALDHLHSVIYFPRTKDITKTQPQFYHASFRDYLEDPVRSGDYAVGQWKPDLLRYLPSMFGGEPCAGKGTPGNWDERNSWELLQDIMESETLSPSGVSVRFLSSQCFIPDTYLQAIFEGLSFRKTLMSDPLRMKGLMMQQRLGQIRVDELQRRGILAVATLDSLGIPPSEQFFVDPRNSGPCFDFRFRGTPPNASSDEDRISELRTSLRRLFSEVPNTKIWMWGYRAGEKCAVIYYNDLPDWWPSPWGIRYQVFITGF